MDEVSRQHVFALLLLSLLGSYVNIPIAELPPEHIRSHLEVWNMGILYVVPEFHDWHRTILAVNVGDLLNLGLLPGLGAPVASIGGAGTFDGVFLTGILAVLLA